MNIRKFNLILSIFILTICACSTIFIATQKDLISPKKEPNIIEVTAINKYSTTGSVTVSRTDSATGTESEVTESTEVRNPETSDIAMLPIVLLLLLSIPAILYSSTKYKRCLVESINEGL